MKVNGHTMHPHYKGTAFHRIVSDFIIQGGDVIDHNGTGSLSIYGRSFPDESFVGKAGAHNGQVREAATFVTLLIPGARFTPLNSTQLNSTRLVDLNSFGTLSMANSGPNTNGSQFFVCLAEAPYLNGKHVVLGKLLEGKDVVCSLRVLISWNHD